MPDEFSGNIYRVASPALEVSRAEGDNPLLRMVFAVYNRWTEINDMMGRYMERIAPGAFTKTATERGSSIRLMLSHGLDPALGRSVLGKLVRLDVEGHDVARADAELFDSVPALLVDGFKAGVYGASFQGRSIKQRIDYTPGKSEHNPDGLPEVTRTEIALKDLGPTPVAAYADTETVMRSQNDEVFAVQIGQNLDLMRAIAETVGAATLERSEEPEPEATTQSTDEPTHSATEQSKTEEVVPSWHLSR